eukprot:2226406-Rhodomonas_salina.3
MKTAQKMHSTSERAHAGSSSVKTYPKGAEGPVGDSEGDEAETLERKLLVRCQRIPQRQVRPHRPVRKERLQDLDALGVRGEEGGVARGKGTHALRNRLVEAHAERVLDLREQEESASRRRRRCWCVSRAASCACACQGVRASVRADGERRGGGRKGCCLLLGQCDAALRGGAVTGSSISACQSQQS